MGKLRRADVCQVQCGGRMIVQSFRYEKYSDTLRVAQRALTENLIRPGAGGRSLQPSVCCVRGNPRLFVYEKSLAARNDQVTSGLRHLPTRFAASEQNGIKIISILCGAGKKL